MRRFHKPFQTDRHRESLNRFPAAGAAPRHFSRRRGLMLAEALIGGITVGGAVMLAMTVMVSVNGNRRAAERVLLATQELSNQMERITSKPWTELTPEVVQQVQISPSAAAGLPNAELKIGLQTVTSPRPGKRLEGELRWQERGNSWRPPLRLTAWVFAPQGAQ